MNYKKIVKDNYSMHLVDTDRFKSIDVIVLFTKKFEKKNRAYYSLLSQNLVYSSKKYDSKNKIAIRGEELYGASVSASYDALGGLENFQLHMNFLNPKYTSEEYYKESIDFLFEILLNPNVRNKKFNPKYFDIVKNDTINTIKSQKDNPSLYSRKQFNKFMYKGTPACIDLTPTIKEVEQINEESLYQFYEELFNGKYKVDVLLLGEINDELVSCIEKKLVSIKSNNKKLNIFINVKYDDKVKEKIDTLHFNQSKLYLGYKLDDLSEYEIKYLMRLYNTILGTMNNSILFSVVREKNSLCYSIGSYYSRYSKSLIIYGGINRDNYEKTVALTKECVESMGDINVIKKMIKPAKKTINTFLNGYYDDAVAQVYNKYINEFADVDDVETIRDIINKIKPEELVEINKKIKLSAIYLLKGDN